MKLSESDSMFMIDGSPKPFVSTQIVLLNGAKSR